MKKVNRRNFIKTAGAATLISALPPNAISFTREKLFWANLLHLSYNMWEDWDVPGKERRSYRPYLRFDENLWNDLLEKMAANHLNNIYLPGYYQHAGNSLDGNEYLLHYKV